MAKEKEAEAKEEKVGFTALAVHDRRGNLARTYHAKHYGEGSANPTKKCIEDAEGYAKKIGGSVRKVS